MRFEVEQELPGTPDDVLGAMAEASWYEAVCRTASDWAPELVETEHVGAVTVAVVRYRFRGELNRAARAVLDAARLVHLDRVTIDHAAGSFMVEVTPEYLADKLSVTASGRVSAAGGACRRVLMGEVKSRYPLVGGQVERAVVSGLLEHAEHEKEAFSAWIAGT